MLIMCPECKKQFSETADSCPKCGFVLDKATRQNLKDKAVRSNRGCLVALAIVLLAFAGPCMISPFTSHSGHVRSTRSEAYSRIQQDKSLSDYDIEALADGVSHVSVEEEKKASWYFFRLGLFMLVLPAAGILIYLYYTKKGKLL